MRISSPKFPISTYRFQSKRFAFCYTEKFSKKKTCDLRAIMYETRVCLLSSFDRNETTNGRKDKYIKKKKRNRKGEVDADFERETKIYIKLPSNFLFSLT